MDYFVCTLHLWTKCTTTMRPSEGASLGIVVGLFEGSRVGAGDGDDEGSNDGEIEGSVHLFCVHSAMQKHR